MTAPGFAPAPILGSLPGVRVCTRCVMDTTDPDISFDDRGICSRFLPTRFGYDKRKTHLSSLICSGQITRDHALRELMTPTYEVDLQRADTEYVIKKLGLTAAGFAAIMNAPKRQFRDFPSHARLRESRAYAAARRIYRLLKRR